MKLALLGADEETLDLLRWAVTQGGHALVVASEAGTLEDEVRAIAPGIRADEDWETLLLGSAIDAVVVARESSERTDEYALSKDERRTDQLRKLVQEKVPLLVTCPACESILGYEIEMIRRDVGGIVLPYIPGSNFSAVAQLRLLVNNEADSPIGNVEQILLQRQERDRTRPRVLVQLARDAAILRELIGPIRSVSASGVPVAGRDPLGPRPHNLPSLSNLSVHFGGEGELMAHWSIGPVVEQAGGTLTLVGDRGSAVLHMPATGEWSIALPVAGNGFTAPLDPEDFAPVFARLQQAVEGGSSHNSGWLNACRDQEAAEAVDRSLLRGRTIELFNEEHTEDAAFKGVMSMGGCLLLLMALCTLLVAALIEGLKLPPRNWPVWRLWPVILLGPIIVFLLLQLLKLAVKREGRSMPSHDPRSI